MDKKVAIHDDDDDMGRVNKMRHNQRVQSLEDFRDNEELYTELRDWSKDYAVGSEVRWSGAEPDVKPGKIIGPGSSYNTVTVRWPDGHESVHNTEHLLPVAPDSLNFSPEATEYYRDQKPSFSDLNEAPDLPKQDPPSPEPGIDH